MSRIAEIALVAAREARPEFATLAWSAVDIAETVERRVRAGEISAEYAEEIFDDLLCDLLDSSAEANGRVA